MPGIAPLLCLLLVAGSVLGTAGASRAAAGAARLDGAFVQLDRGNADWSRERWRRELHDARELGLGTLVVQWCRQPGATYLAPPSAPGPSGAVATLVSLAGEMGLELYLGLYHDPAFWSRIGAPAEEVRAYLHSLLGANLEVAREVVHVVRGAAAFRGFYIPQEVDDLSWRQPGKRAALAWFLGALVGELDRIGPEARVLASTFARGRTSPGGFAELWSELLAAAPLDALLFQDGAGGRGLEAPAVSRYLEELEAVRGSAGLWAVVEVFQVLEEGDGVFRARSAGWPGVRGQLRVAARHADRALAFSLRYLSAAGGVDGAAELAGSYRRAVGTAR